MGGVIAVPVAIIACFIAAKFSDNVTWLRWAIAYVYIKFLRRRTKQRFDLYDMDSLDDPVKIGMLIPQEEVILESPQETEKAGDEIFFYGVNSSSECFMARIARRHNKAVESSIYLKLKNGKAYQLDDTCGQLHLSKDSRTFSCGGLKMHYIEPMRRWRILFKGLMREIGEDGVKLGKTLYIKFAFRWRASSDCFDTYSDIDISALSSSIARTRWKGFLPNVTQLNDAVNSYSQAGVIRGQVTVDGSFEDEEMYLFGEKIRHLGNISSIEGSKTSHLLGWISENGIIVHFTSLYIPNIAENLLYGYIVTPDGKLEVVRNVKITEGDMTDESKLVTFVFDDTDMKWELNANIHEKHWPIGVKSDVHQHMRMSRLTMKLNPYFGKGILMERTVLKSPKEIVSASPVKRIPKDIPLVLGFREILCQDATVTGGKGSSLGRLTELSKAYQTFIVPNGFVLTTKAYGGFITDKILKEIKCLEDTLYQNISGDLKKACSRVMDAIIETNLPDQLLKAIVEYLRGEFGENFERETFAVRSSATGEDTEDMSAAGQMETFLGVSGLDQIVMSVKKCWASQFDFVASQYKRHNGQILNSPMAVVIQEMVPCDVAGVLFTCDPLTGNPTIMAITSNYGLGESVVSGSEEPDTIVLERDEENALKLKEKTIGAKSHRFVVKDAAGTTVQEDVPEVERQACSLTDALSLRLGKVALNIEKDCGSSRDIEWGYWNNNLYIFQSRPVTSNTDETDYEIDHENDSPMRVENDYFSVCNVGEVLPGATSPLGQETMTKFFAAVFQRRMFRSWRPNPTRYCPKGMSIMYNHVMFYATDLFELINEGKNFVHSQMISLFGRLIEDEELLKLALERHSRRKKLFITTKIMMYMMGIFLSPRMLKKTRKIYKNYRIPVENSKTAQELFDELLKFCTYPAEALICHMMCSSKSTTANLLLMTVLEKAKGELDVDVYSDLSMLLSSITEVESADVPSALESLAFHISKDIDPTNFQKMSAESAEEWLMSSPTESGQKFREFLEKHGHRCLKELDIESFTWSEKPGCLVKMLQNIVGSVSSDRVAKKNKSFQEIVSGMKIPLSNFSRFILRFVLLPLGRSGVQAREASKSLWIKVQNEWRKGYRRLGKLMAAEGRLPDEGLIYFMTVMEIRDLLATRSPKIISRAVHRRRRHQILDGYLFPEIMSGLPKPINITSTDIVESDENVSMKGIPVSQGVAKGFARVALNLEEASHLKPGEILLTYSTDIGWTPYFPALAGVGTELGGLISHGAVVSREYGLPCIAGLHGVIRQFRTGDYVLLDGNKGLLQKLPPPE